MDAIRVSKVDNVVCTKQAVSSLGTLHLTAHHLIFRYDNDNEEEMWVPYPLISLVTRLPLTLQGKCPLTFHCRTFESFSLLFLRDTEAVDVFESVKELTVATSVTQLYAFFYVPNPPLGFNSGWSLYSPREEFGRMGVGTRTKAWRFTDINKDYSFCATYPARLVVPTKISDTTLQYAAKYRSKCRIPVLTYLHWGNYGTITRSSQPMVGLTQSRSIQDEKLIESVFQSHYSPDSRASNTPIYGATATNIIIDARPTTNAVANTAKGAGTENMDNYKEAKKAYLGIDNIHVMRDSLNKVVEALREADSMSASVSEDLNAQVPGITFLDRQALRRSGWLRHIATILEGSLLIIRNVHVNSSHVLIHCSDGWDRTAQLSSVAQLCLDPFFRTFRGFQILIEKDWLAFGHKFLDRCGHLSSDKFFVSPIDTAGAGDGGAQSFLASVQNRFASPQHLKETSPVFHQFLETVRQVQRQFPDRFEFNRRFLEQIHYHLYACQFGTFLFNCERDRRVAEADGPYVDRTVSVWDLFNSPNEIPNYINPDYNPSLDDPTSRLPKADMGVLFPNPKDVRFWHELYGRTDEEMNGRIVVPQADIPEVIGPIEQAEDDPIVVGTPSALRVPLPPSPSPSPLSASANLPASTSALKIAVLPLTASLDSSSPRMRPESPRPMSSSRPPASPTLSSAPSLSSSAAFSRASATDLFASSGVRSVWGKLSSNASAAFSVVQDAYVSVAKDLKGDLAPGERELMGKPTRPGDWNDWEEDQHASAPSAMPLPPSLPFGPSSNPWATSKVKPNPQPPSVQSIYDNPWGSVRGPPSSQRHDLAHISPTALFDSKLPPDPTVAHPSPRPVGPTRSATSTVPASDAQMGGDNGGIPLQAPSRTDSDPLGVGW